MDRERSFTLGNLIHLDNMTFLPGIKIRKGGKSGGGRGERRRENKMKMAALQNIFI